MPSVIVSAKVPTAGTGIAAIVKDGIGGEGRGGEGMVNTELPFVGTGASTNHSFERIDGSARWSSSSRSHSRSNGAQRRWKGGRAARMPRAKAVMKAWRAEWIQVGMLKGLFKGRSPPPSFWQQGSSSVCGSVDAV